MYTKFVHHALHKGVRVYAFSSRIYVKTNLTATIIHIHAILFTHTGKFVHLYSGTMGLFRVLRNAFHLLGQSPSYIIYAEE